VPGPVNLPRSQGLDGSVHHQHIEELDPDEVKVPKVEKVIKKS